MLNNSAYPNFKSHRADTVAREFRTYVRRVLCHPIEILKRQITTRRIKNSGQAYHLVLMQLEHDSAFLMHSPFASMPEFLHCVIKAFAAGAPRHHRLVFKAHPLESGRRALAREIAALAARYKIADRVDYVPGGKLAQLLDHARSAVTVNSTAGQQALWRGLPLKAFGKAVYDKTQFVSDLPLEEFFCKTALPGQCRLSRLPALLAGDLPNSRRILFHAGAPAIAAASYRYALIRPRSVRLLRIWQFRITFRQNK